MGLLQGFLSPGTDVTPIVPALEKIWADSMVQSMANFNFRLVTSKFNDLVYEYPIRIPERYALVIRRATATPLPAIDAKNADMLPTHLDLKALCCLCLRDAHLKDLAMLLSPDQWTMLQFLSFHDIAERGALESLPGRAKLAAALKRQTNACQNCAFWCLIP